MLNQKKHKNSKGIVRNAFNIYDEIGIHKHYSIIQIVLKICLHFNEDSNKLDIVWNDIKNLQKEIEEIQDSTLYSLLLTCYIKSKNKNIKDCIELLKYIKQYNKSINIDGSFITKLILKCGDDIESLEFMEYLIEYGLFRKENCNNMIIKNTLINSYGRCSNQFQNALKVFNSISSENRDIVTINNMMKVYLKYKYYKEVVDLYDNTDNKLKDDICHRLSIIACSKSQNYLKGKEIHSVVSNSNNIQIKNVLIEMYATFKDMDNALNVFHSIPENQMNTVTINTMLSVFINNKYYKKLLKLYDKYSNETIVNGITHMLALKGCSMIGDIEKGKEIHFILESANYLNNNYVNSLQIKTSLIDFYGNCCVDIDNALKVFNSIYDDMKDIISINCMMKAYISNGNDKEALELFDQCIDGRYKKINDYNNISRILALKACTNTGNVEKGKSILNNKYFNIHHKNNEIELKCTLIDFYGNCLEIDNALKIFNLIDDNNKDIAIIAAMMNAYCISNMHKEAVLLFMKYFIDNNDLKLIPDKICYSVFFDVCTESTSLYFGQQIHDKLKLERNWSILNDSEIQAKIINMYGKCGVLQKCDEIFNDIEINEANKYKTDISIWNAMMHSYGRNGDIDKTKQLYDRIKMIDTLIMNGKTYAILINACSHCGDIEEAQNIWNYGIHDVDLKYNSFVVTTLIDCFSRKGELRKAYELMMNYNNYSNKFDKIDNSNDTAMWLSLLSGCRRYKNSELAQKIYNQFEEKMKTKYGRDNEEYKRKYIGSASILLANTYTMI